MGKSLRTAGRRRSAGRVRPETVMLYGDGSAQPNPGRAGYAAIVVEADHCQTVTGGFKRSTNNRMELLAVIHGLEAVSRPSHVLVHTDSTYVAGLLSPKRLLPACWKAEERSPRRNGDLLERLWRLCRHHRSVSVQWTRRHSGVALHDRCDALAKAARLAPDLPRDIGFLKPPGKKPK